MINRRQLLSGAVGLGAFAVAGGVTACSTGGSGSAPAGGVVTLEVWDYLGQGASNDAMVAAVNAFEAANPTIKIKRTSFSFGDLSKSIVQGGVGGSLPDLAICDNVDNQNFAALGLLADVTDAVGSEKDNFFEGPWSSAQLGGKSFGLPLNSNNLALYCNMDMFTAAGVSIPTTWDELEASAKALTKDGVTGLAVSGIKNEQGTFQVLPFVWQTGGDLDNYDESGAEALEFLKNMIDQGSISSSMTNWSQEDCRTQFTTGKVAMMSNGPWELANMEDVDFAWSVAPLPKGKVAATGLGGENVVLFKTSKNTDAATTFLKYITGPEGAKIYCDASGQLSSRPDLRGKLAGASDPNVQVFEKQLDVARARAYGAKYAEISTLVQLSIQEALTGVKPPAQAAQDAFVQIQPLLPS